MAESNEVQPLTTDEIRANAAKWTLAGDAGLLAHLQKLSQEIITKAESAESSLNNLLDRVDETCTNFNNVSNRFLSLQNSQFLENRVYDDETPTEERQPKPVMQEPTQQQNLEKYKKAVEQGLSLLDTHFEQVEVPDNSDSEEEPSGSDGAIIWRPKPRYTAPLPLLIGSAEWWADDNVGLGEFVENEDSEPGLSLSDREGDLRPNVEKRLRLSSSSSLEDVVPEIKMPALSSQDVPTFKDPHYTFKPVQDLFVTANSNKSESDVLFGGDQGSDSGQSHFDRQQDHLFSPDSRLDDEAGVFGSIKKFPVPVKGLPATGGDMLVPAMKNDDLFGDDNDDSLFAGGDSAQIAPKSVHTRISNAFTEELVAKLGTVVKHQRTEDPPPDLTPIHKAKVGPPLKLTPTENKVNLRTTDGLFGDDADDDFLFGAGSKKEVKSVAKNYASPGLFDNSDDDSLFSGKAEEKSKPRHGSLLKPTADLFADDLDQDLFAPTSSARPTPKVTFPRVMLSSDNNDESPVPATGPKSSTPAIQGTPALATISTPNLGDDLFGEISSLGDESNCEDHSRPSLVEMDEDNEGNISMVEDESRDLGFIETSAISDQNTNPDNHSKDSPANWFQPQLSSTRAAAISNETSGYKTGNVWPSTDSASHGVSGYKSPGKLSASDTKSHDKRISSISKKHDSSQRKDKEEEVEDLFPGESVPSRTANKIKWQDANDDLFSAPSGIEKSDNSSVPLPEPRRPHSTSQLFKEEISDTDDLFVPKNFKPKPDDNISSKTSFKDEQTSKRSENILHDSKEVVKGVKKSNDDLFSGTSKGSSWKAIFDDNDDDSLFDDGRNKNVDNISVSSSRSSNFDENKSSLPSIFGNDPKDKVKVMKISLFDNVDDDFDLFSKKSEICVRKEVEKKDLQKTKEEPVLEGNTKIFKTPSIFPDEEENSLFNPKPKGNEDIKKVAETLLIDKNTQNIGDSLKEYADISAITSNTGGEKLDGNLFSMKPDLKEESTIKTPKRKEYAKAEKNDLEETFQKEQGSPGDDNYLHAANLKVGLKAVKESDRIVMGAEKSEKAINKVDDVNFIDSTVEHRELQKERKDSVTVLEGSATEDTKSVMVTSEKKTGIIDVKDSDLFSSNATLRETHIHNTDLDDVSYLLPSKNENVHDKAQNSCLFEDEDKSISGLISKPEKIASKFGSLSTNDPKNCQGSEIFLSGSLEDDDLFCGSVQKAASKHVKDLSIGQKTKKVETEVMESVTQKPKPPSTLNIVKTSDLFDEPDCEVSKMAVIKKISKLNIPSDLKINPTALLPGAKLVKPKLDNNNKGEKPEDQSLSPPSDRTEEYKSSNVLKSALRDRARIPGKRRPQTRKARLEALRTSGIDFAVDLDNPPSPSVDDSPTPAVTSSASNPLSTSTDEEDYFKVPELDSNEKEYNMFDKEPRSTKVDDDTLLFGNPVVISPNEKTSSIKLLAGASEPENIPIQKSSHTDNHNVDDLFGDTSEGLFADEAQKVVPSKTFKSAIAKSSLFGDSYDDDDDIFSGIPKTTPPIKNSVAAKKPISVESILKPRIEGVKEPFVDPLGLLTDPSE